MLQKIKTVFSKPSECCSGYLPDIHDPRDHVRELKSANAPARLDLRAHGRRVALDQKQTRACTGYSASAFMSCLHGVYLSGGKWEASPMFIYYKTRQLFGTTVIDSGAPLRLTLQALQQFGVCPMAAHPDLHDWSTPPTPEAENMARLLRVKEYLRIVVGPDAPQTMVDTLHAERLPILIGVKLFSEVNSPSVRFNGDIPLPAPESRFIGGHAMMLDGYDQDKQRFYGWNSWGRSWGRGGRFSLPFEYFTSRDTCMDIWTVTYRYW